MPLKIIEVTDLPEQTKKDIVAYLVRSFKSTVAARSEQIDSRYKQWLDNYNAIPKQKTRSTPFPNASNFIPQLVRMHVDILSARLLGILYGTRPFWRPTTFLSGVPQDEMNALAQWMQHITFNRIQMFPVIDELITSTFKCGTDLVKDWWSIDERYQAADRDERGNIRETKLALDDLRIDTVPFEDIFPYPITAKRVEFTEILFHRIRLTEQEVKWRKDMRTWDPEAVDLLLKGKGATGGSNTQQNQLQNTGITLTADTGKPYTAIEAHFCYPLQPGKKYPLVCVFNPMFEDPKSILRFYHKPDKDPFSSCFTDFRFLPRKDSFFGDSIPMILEQSQEEIAQIHNARRDANTIANVPAWKKKRLADVASPSTEWFPGKVFEVDSMDDIEPLAFGGNYNSMVEEESFMMQTAERYTGVTPAMQGMGAGVNGKRGTYASQGTLAMIAEGNRRIDVFIKRLRMPFNTLGKRIYTSYRDFGDPNVWNNFSQNGKLLTTTFQRDLQLQGGNTFFELAASDAGANRETDRSGLLLMANTMSSYYHELVSFAQIIVSAPDGSPFKELGLQVMDGARDLANRLLFVFDVGDRERLLPDLRKVLGGGDPNQGSAAPQPGAAAASGLPEPQGDVSVGDVQSLSQQFAAITGGLSPQGRAM